MRCFVWKEWMERGIPLEQDRISTRQLGALLWAGLMAPAAELLPAVTLPLAGRAAWLSALAALPVVLLIGWGLARLDLHRGGLAGAVCREMGPWAGKGVLLFYIVWGELLLALRLRLCAQRLLTAGERDGSLWFFLPAAAALVLWMARGKLSAFARAGQVFLAVLLTAAAAVLLLSLPQTKGEHLLPLWWGDLPNAVRAAVPVLGVLGYGMFAGFLVGDLEAARPGRNGWILWSAGGCCLLALSQAVVIGNLGPALAKRLDDPFFALAKSIGVEGAFQRVESIIAAVWTFADLTLMGLLAFAVWRAAAGVIPRLRQKPAVTAAVLTAVVLGVAAFPDGISAERAGRGIALWGNLIAGVGIPALVVLISWVRGNLQD